MFKGTAVTLSQIIVCLAEMETQHYRCEDSYFYKAAIFVLCKNLSILNSLANFVFQDTAKKRKQNPSA